MDYHFENLLSIPHFEIRFSSFFSSIPRGKGVTRQIGSTDANDRTLRLAVYTGILRLLANFPSSSKHISTTRNSLLKLFLLQLTTSTNHSSFNTSPTYIYYHQHEWIRSAQGTL